MEELLEEKEVVDEYQEHKWHQSGYKNHPQCSECYKEEYTRQKTREEARRKLIVCNCVVCSGRGDVDTRNY